jgi:pimeloyl-ACP methyl ester carboxylesterase
MTKIIFIPGNNTSRSLHLIEKSNWEEVIKKEFPSMNVEILYSPYDMWDIDLVQNTTAKLIQEIIEVDDNMILMGYSFGGLIVRLGYQKLPEIHQKKIKAIITMGTPHRIPNRRQRKFVEGTLGLIRSVDVPMLALTGYLDTAALPYFARLRGVIMKTRSFWCFHPDFFYSKNIRKKVVKEMKQFFKEYSIS